MSLIGWIVLGLIAGWIASKVWHGSGSGLVMNLALGVVGAFVGGFLSNLLGGAGMTGFNLWSLVVATLGAIIVLWIYGLVAGRRA